MSVAAEENPADWHRRVVSRSLRTATQRSIDRGTTLVRVAAQLLERSNGEGFTVQDVADEACQSLRTLYQYFESKDDLLLAVFEDAMRGYAAVVRGAIAELDDPLERLGAALLLAMTDRSSGGVSRGLMRLRMQLASTEPELLTRAEAPVASFLHDLVADAAAAGRITARDTEAATFLVQSMLAAAITNSTLGDDVGTVRPTRAAVVTFALQGLGADMTPGWVEGLDARTPLEAP